MLKQRKYEGNRYKKNQRGNGMYHIVNDFERTMPFDIKAENIQLVCGNTIPVYQIETPHDLIRFVGYGKYINKEIGNVLFRGQNSIYDGALLPSLYRGKNNLSKITHKYNNRIEGILKNNRYFKKINRGVFEPILQHYGIKTPYIDLVDNIWVALWFASHQTISKCIKSHEYVYYFRSKKEFAYIELLASDAKDENNQFGIYTGKESTLVDLRKATPSYFLRPHAQHAYMIRKNEMYPSDYTDLIIGIAKIPTVTVHKWLGSNEFLKLRFLFPAANFDTGYKVLLDRYPEEDYGAIRHYGSIQILTD